MLELRPNCECCDRDLPPDSRDAMICTLRMHVLRALRRRGARGKCPNCGGELVRRPVRPADKLLRNPASTKRIVKVGGCQAQ